MVVRALGFAHALAVAWWSVAPRLETLVDDERRHRGLLQYRADHDRPARDQVHVAAARARREAVHGPASPVATTCAGTSRAGSPAGRSRFDFLVQFYADAQTTPIDGAAAWSGRPRRTSNSANSILARADLDDPATHAPRNARSMAPPSARGTASTRTVRSATFSGRGARSTSRARAFAARGRATSKRLDELDQRALVLIAQPRSLRWRGIARLDVAGTEIVPAVGDEVRTLADAEQRVDRVGEDGLRLRVGRVVRAGARGRRSGARRRPRPAPDRRGAGPRRRSPRAG